MQVIVQLSAAELAEMDIPAEELRDGITNALGRIDLQESGTVYLARVSVDVQVADAPCVDRLR